VNYHCEFSYTTINITHPIAPPRKSTNKEHKKNINMYFVEDILFYPLAHKKDDSNHQKPLEKVGVQSPNHCIQLNNFIIFSNLISRYSLRPKL